MRILLVSDDPDDPTVGASKVPRKLRAELRALGHTCDALFSEHLGEWPRNERWRFLLSPWLSCRAARRVWRERGPYDVIDAAGAEGGVIALARRFGQFRGARVVARSHGLEHIYYRELINDHRAGLLHKPWWRRLWYPATRLAQVGLAFRRADHAILLNQQGRTLAIERGWQPEHRISLIAHGVDAERWDQAPLPTAPRGAGVLFSGAWYTGKGIAYLAEAQQRLLRRGVALPLTLLGGGIGYPHSVVEAHVRASFAPECQPWLTVLPRLRDEDAVFALYRSHDLLVCPSTAEGFGMVVLEAVSQRLPVVCTRAVGAADLLRPEVDALIVPPRDAAGLADALQRLWQDAALRARLAESAHAHLRHCTWRRAAERTLEAYAAAGARVAGSVAG